MKKTGFSKLVIVAFLLVLAHSFSLFAQVPSGSTDGLDGRWQKTQLLCRYAKEGKYEYFHGKLIDADPKIFDVEVELKISSTVKPGMMVERHVEKSVLQSSCKLNENSKVSEESLSAPYIWSKNKVQFTSLRTNNNISYYLMTGKLVDKFVNYGDIRGCGSSHSPSIAGISAFGLLSSLDAFFKYDFPVFGENSSYFNKEANRKYVIYRYQEDLYLEFKDEDICEGDGTALMIFSKNN